ncbi:MAG: hypothetical protein RhofKO_28330 [Rhodothermales bacterium]
MPTPSRFRRIARWFPVGLLVALLIGGWLAIRGGGTMGITVWYLYTGFWPVLAVLLFVGMAIYALVKQRRSATVLTPSP